MHDTGTTTVARTGRDRRNEPPSHTQIVIYSMPMRHRIPGWGAWRACHSPPTPRTCIVYPPAPNRLNPNRPSYPARLLKTPECASGKQQQCWADEGGGVPVGQSIKTTGVEAGSPPSPPPTTISPVVYRSDPDPKIGVASKTVMITSHLHTRKSSKQTNSRPREGWGRRPEAAPPYSLCSTSCTAPAHL